MRLGGISGQATSHLIAGPEELLKGMRAAERAAIMFSGKTGVPVASGEGAVASRPTLGLLVEVSAAVEGLPACIFDKFAELRPCGLLCKR